MTNVVSVECFKGSRKQAPAQPDGSSFLDVGTAAHTVFLGHFSFAQNPGGPYGDKALHNRQGLQFVIPSASSHTHAHTRAHRPADCLTHRCYA